MHPLLKLWDSVFVISKTERESIKTGTEKSMQWVTPSNVLKKRKGIDWNQPERIRHKRVGFDSASDK